MKNHISYIGLIIIAAAGFVHAQSFDLMTAGQSDKIASSEHYVVTEYGIEYFEPANITQPISVSTFDTLFVATTATMTSVNNHASFPVTTALSQNYPNPFNNATVIGYSVDRPSDIVVKVYDITGKEVATLVNERKPTGAFSVNFNNSDIATGTYFYRLVARSDNGKTTVETKKMVVMK